MSAVEPAAVAAKTLQQLEDAWNAADGAAFATSFGPDADFVDIRGGHHRGAGEIGHGHQGIFDSVYAGSTVRYALESAREASAGTVVAVAGATLDNPAGPMRGITRSRLTAVLTEGENGWQVTAFHNTLVQSGG